MTFIKGYSKLAWIAVVHVKAAEDPGVRGENLDTPKTKTHRRSKTLSPALGNHFVLKLNEIGYGWVFNLLGAE